MSRNVENPIVIPDNRSFNDRQQRHLNVKLKTSRCLRQTVKSRYKINDDNKYNSSKTVKERVKDIEKENIGDENNERNEKKVKMVKRNKISYSPTDKKKIVTKSGKKSTRNDKIVVNGENTVKNYENMKVIIDKKKSPSVKMKIMIDAFEKNVKEKDKKEMQSIKMGKVKQVGKTDENETNVKNSFGRLLESAKGGKFKIISPGRKSRKKIGALRTPGKEAGQSTIEEWLKKLKE